MLSRNLSKIELSKETFNRPQSLAQYHSFFNYKEEFMKNRFGSQGFLMNVKNGYF